MAPSVIVEVRIGRGQRQVVLRYKPPLKQARKILSDMLFGLAPFTETKHGASRIARPRLSHGMRL